MERWTVGILIFDGVEVLDFAGPFEVFSRARTIPGADSRRTEDSAPFVVFTVGRSTAPVTATGGLSVAPRYSFTNVPRIDLLVVPGGFGTRALLKDDKVLDWIRRTAVNLRQLTSVCTGSLLYAKAGLPQVAFDAFAAALDTCRKIAEEGGPRDRYRFTKHMVESVLVYTVPGSADNCLPWPTGRGSLLRNAHVLD